MAKSKQADKVKAIKNEKAVKDMTPEERADAICPTCGVGVSGHKCRLCGATKSVNAASGNQIWMRNGRLIAAFRDGREAYVRMASQYGIPENEWPEEFRTSPQAQG